MDRVRLWATAKERIPFRVAQRILKKNRFPTGPSWAAIESKMADGDDKGSFQGLQQGLIESLAVGEKSLQLYRLSEDDMRQCYKVVSNLQSNIPTSTLRDEFPYLLPPRSLEKVAVRSPIVVEVIENDYATVVFYSYSRIVETRDELPLQILSSNSSDYTQVIGIRRKLVQGFASVIVPHFGEIVQVYVDAPANTPIKAIEVDRFAVVAAFNSLFPRSVLTDPLNLYPAVQRLYESDEGVVSHLGHTVATSVKHERMRGPGRCVRQELFHSGGVDAVDGQITPFSIEVVWGAEDESMQGFNPSLSLDGTYMMTYSSMPVIGHATIRKCAYISDAAHVVARLLAHLP